MNNLKHFKCPDCKRVTATDGFVPKCRCKDKGMGGVVMVVALRLSLEFLIS